MDFPNSTCGKCPVWLSINDDNFEELIEKHCRVCLSTEGGPEKQRKIFEKENSK